MSFLDRAEKALRKLRRAALTQRVIYLGADGLRYDTIATQGTTSIETLDGPVDVVGANVDWIVERSDIELRDPVAGDKIFVYANVGDETYERVYEACSVGGSAVYTTHGRDGQSVRIHTKLISTPEARGEFLYPNGFE